MISDGLVKLERYAVLFSQTEPTNTLLRTMMGALFGFKPSH